MKNLIIITTIGIWLFSFNPNKNKQINNSFHNFKYLAPAILLASADSGKIHFLAKYLVNFDQSKIAVSGAPIDVSVDKTLENDPYWPI